MPFSGNGFQFSLNVEGNNKTLKLEWAKTFMSLVEARQTKKMF